MEQIFAKHADVGDLHLETKASDNKWEWLVFDTKKNVKIATGKAESSAGAKLAAEQAEGGSPAQWRDVGIAK